MNRRALIVIPVSCALGCASTGIVTTDPGVYLVSRRHAQFGFGPPVTATAQVYREAGEFCAEQGRQVETVALDQTSSSFGRPASATLQFRCSSRSP